MRQNYYMLKKFSMIFVKDMIITASVENKGKGNTQNSIDLWRKVEALKYKPWGHKSRKKLLKHAKN